MLKKAIRNNPKFRLDSREIREVGESYSVETLRALHQEFSDKHVAFCFILGADAFLKLPSWYQWQDLFKLCHLVVVNRPGFNQISRQAELPQELAGECWNRWVERTDLLKQNVSGYVYCASTTLLDISATTIRHAILRGKSVRYLLPDSVLNYIYTFHVYHGEK